MTSIINLELWHQLVTSSKAHYFKERHDRIALMLPINKNYPTRECGNISPYLKVIFSALDFGWVNGNPQYTEIASVEDLDTFNLRVSDNINELTDRITGKIIHWDDDTEYGSMELLGEYVIDDDNEVAEGKIIIYQKRIEQVAQYYVGEVSANDPCSKELLTQAITDLTEIALAHVTVHWMLHTFRSPGWLDTSKLSDGMKPFEYDSYPQIYFHEAVAQLLTYIFIKDDERMLRMFNWLGAHQSQQYRAYLELYNNGMKTAKHVLSLLEAFNEVGLQCYYRLSTLSNWETRVEINDLQSDIFGADSFKSNLMNDEYRFNIIAIRYELLLCILDFGRIKIDWLSLGNKYLDEFSHLPTSQTNWLRLLIRLKEIHLIGL